MLGQPGERESEARARGSGSRDCCQRVGMDGWESALGKGWKVRGSAGRPGPENSQAGET